jgi:hypothetical protein
MKPHVLIGIAGQKYAGKDTAAKGIMYAPGWQSESFAAPIRQAACALFDIDLDTLNQIKHEAREELGGKSLRDFMQLMGTEFGRNMIDPGMWLQCLRTRIQDHKKVIVTDVRFPNEVDFIHSLGGIVIEIQRPSIQRNDAHASETPLPREMVDFVVMNDSTVDVLQKRVRELVKQFVGKPNGKVDSNRRAEKA